MTHPTNSYQHPTPSKRRSSPNAAGEKSWYENRDNVIIGALAVVDVLLLVLFVSLGVSSFGWFSSSESHEAGTQGVETNAPTAGDPGPVESGDTGGSNADGNNDGSGVGSGTGVELPGVTDSDSATRFATPTGNISCTISPNGVNCAIAKLAKAPKPNTGGCEGYIGYVVNLNSAGVALPCVAKEDLPGGAGGSLDVLDYEKSETVNNFTCESTRSGVKCTDKSTGQGFTVARAGISTF